jgi:hypothetical protein
VQADVDLDEELGTSVSASKPAARPSAEARLSTATVSSSPPRRTSARRSLVGTERRVVDEDSGSARLVEDLFFTCLRDGQTRHRWRAV